MVFSKKWLVDTGLMAALAAIYLLQTLPLAGWMVDDAGVSFSYARNLAAGDGLVSQPGQVPVEGYSNPLWVFILSIFPLVKVDIAAAVRPLSIVLTVAAVAVFYLALRRLKLSPLFAFVSAGWVVCQPAFIIWSAAGLENPLYVLLIALLLWMTAKQEDTRGAISAGVLAGLISITRPEGILYSCFYPLFHRKRLKPYLPGLLAIFGGYMVFRLAYFGDLFPNPYYKKSELFFSSDWWVNMTAKAKGVLLGMFGSEALVMVVAALCLLGALYYLRKRTAGREVLLPGALLVVAAGGYFLLPKDWMGEYRYATPVFLAAYALIAAAVEGGFQSGSSKAYPKWIALGVLFIWLAGTTVFYFRPRLEQFARNPTITFSGVAADFKRFEAYGKALNLQQEISVLTPDVGGALYYFPHIRIYDLGGLVDPVMARTLGRDEHALRDYIFSRQPHFIKMHGGWSYAAKLDNDERFRRLYVPIFEYVDADLRDKYKMEMHSGDYVRKDLLTSPDMLLALQKLSPSWK